VLSSVCIASNSRMICELRICERCRRNWSWHIEIHCRNLPAGQKKTHTEKKPLLFRPCFETRHFVSISIGRYPFGRSVFWGGRGWLKVSKDARFTRTARQAKWLMEIRWCQLQFHCHCCLKHVYCIQLSVILLTRRWARTPRNRGSISARTGILLLRNIDQDASVANLVFSRYWELSFLW
jgi:hypothetical protein